MNISRRKQMKRLEVQRRDVLRAFLISASEAAGDSWGKLQSLCYGFKDSSVAFKADASAVDSEIAAKTARGVAHKVGSGRRQAQVRLSSTEFNVDFVTVFG